MRLLHQLFKKLNKHLPGVTYFDSDGFSVNEGRGPINFAVLRIDKEEWLLYLFVCGCRLSKILTIGK